MRAIVAVVLLCAIYVDARADVVTCANHPTCTVEVNKPKASLVASDLVLWCESGGTLVQGAIRGDCAVPAQRWLRFDNLQDQSWTFTTNGWYRNVNIVDAPPVVIPPPIPVPPKPFVAFVPPMYPKPFGAGTEYRTDTVNPRGGNTLANDSVLAYFYNDGFKWTCYGFAGNPSTWAREKFDLVLGSITALILGDRGPADATLKSNMNRFLTAEEATVRDALCASIPRPLPPLNYVVLKSTSGTRPVYPLTDKLGTKKIGDIATGSPCDCVKQRFISSSLYCSVEGQSKIVAPGTPAALFPANSVAICAKK
jgi:hypothetical protein